MVTFLSLISDGQDGVQKLRLKERVALLELAGQLPGAKKLLEVIADRIQSFTFLPGRIQHSNQSIISDVCLNCRNHRWIWIRFIEILKFQMSMIIAKFEPNSR